MLDINELPFESVMHGSYVWLFGIFLLQTKMFHYQDPQFKVKLRGNVFAACVSVHLFLL